MVDMINEVTPTSFDDKILGIKRKTHPAFDYFRLLIYWQRKHFNEMLSK